MKFANKFYVFAGVWLVSCFAAGLALAGPEGWGSSATNAGGEKNGAAHRWMQNEHAGARLIDCLLANPQLTAEIGVNADTVARLREDSSAIQVRRGELDARIQKLSLAQADHMAKVLMAPNASTNEVMSIIDEIGRLRTEQAKLTVQTLMVVRKYLTLDQIHKARVLMRELNGGGPASPAKKEKNSQQPPGGMPPAKPPEGL